MDSNIQWRQIKYPLDCWYRQVLPLGTRELILPESAGNYEYYIDGKKQSVKDNKIILSGKSKNHTAVLAVKATLGDSDKGLIAPIKAVCGTSRTETLSWDDLGLNWFTGRAIYSKEFTLPADFKDKDMKIILDPGEVKWFAEIWINGELVNHGPWGDYRTDVTGHLKKGKNRVSIVVSNLNANQALYAIPDATLDDYRNRWWQQGATLREKERLESGLIGPVQLIPLIPIQQELKGN